MLFAHYKLKLPQLTLQKQFAHSWPLSTCRFTVTMTWKFSKGHLCLFSQRKPTKYYAQNLSVSLRIHYIYALHFEHFFRLTFSSTTVFQQYLWEILNIKQTATAIQNKLKNELQNHNDFSYYHLEVLLVTCRCVWSHLSWYSKQLSPTDVFSSAKK